MITARGQDTIYPEQRQASIEFSPFARRKLAIGRQGEIDYNDSLGHNVTQHPDCEEDVEKPLLLVILIGR